MVGDFSGASYPCPTALPFGMYDTSIGWTPLVGLRGPEKVKLEEA